MRKDFARTWFFATSVKPTKTASGTVLPQIVAKLHDLMHDGLLHEYQWAEISAGGAVDGWFQPTDVTTYDLIAALPGVTLLPHLMDPSPVGNDLEKLLVHAGVKANDTAFQAVSKLSNHHHKSPDGFKHPGLRPQLY